jgi:uncharacterized protein YbjT (DUF2867 family)
MEDKKRITVFGATGNIGQELIPLLSQAGVETVAVTRILEKARAWPYIHWMTANIANTESLHLTLEGSTAVFLLSGSSPDFVAEQNNVIQIARQSGVKHIVKLSSGAANPDSPFYIPRTHGVVEDLLRSSGMSWTMLRPNGIMQNWLGDIASSVRISRRFKESTGEGRRTHVDRRDIAETAFKCLTSPEDHYNKTYLLTSERAVNYFDVASAIGQAIGEPVEYIPISLDEARQHMKEAGMPPAVIDTFIAYDKDQLEGNTAGVTDHVRLILGKPARTLDEFARDYAGFFK